MTLVSVIVPVYKIEDYLRKCVDSILAQTYKNLEIILIDDGSPDNCGNICDEYALLDKRIKVIHKENGGLSDARNAGLDICTGEYIAFVDSDDWVDKDYIATFMEYAQPDTIVCCGYKRIYFNKSIHHRMYEIQEFTSVETIKIQQEQEIAVSTGASNINPITNAAWNKLYPKKLFDDIRFPVGKVYEDIYVCFELFLKSQRVVVLPNTTYNYLCRESSICGSPSVKSIKDSIDARLKQEKDVRVYPELLKNAHKLTFNSRIGFYSGYVRGFYNIEKDEREQLKEYFRENSNMVSIREWKLFTKYHLILRSNIALKYLFKIWDCYKRVRCTVF
ncbi:MAG: glycosyltransferase family 2 protein [Phascolarctobacterium sp.]|nr:glycosyltransferase family 2 protein [Phascolarctobacterium sp.]